MRIFTYWNMGKYNYIEILRMLQTMKSKQSIGTSNNRLKSFLSPYSKFGVRSLSTNDSQLCTPASNQPHKTYIDFRRINRQKQNKPNLRIKVEDFNKKDNKKDYKLYKCTMNKFRQNNNSRQEKDNGGDLLKMVRQLKQRVINLQLQNRILKEKQQEDIKRIHKQNEIIKNLQEAICLNRSHASYSMITYPKESRHLCLSDVPKQHKNTNNTLELGNEGKIVKLQQQNVKLAQKYNLLLQQNRMMKNLTQAMSQPSPNSYPYQKQRVEGLEKALKEIQERKLKQLEEIDQILFGSCF